MLTGDNGLLTKAVQTKEVSEIKQIEEKANFVKLNLSIDELSSFKSERLEMKKLAEAINEDFIGSTLIGVNLVVTENRKYDIIVTNELDIIVQKHTDQDLLIYDDVCTFGTKATIRVNPVVCDFEAMSFRMWSAKKLYGNLSAREKLSFLINKSNELNEMQDPDNYVPIPDEVPSEFSSAEEALESILNGCTFDCIEELMGYLGCSSGRRRGRIGEFTS